MKAQVSHRGAIALLCLLLPAALAAGKAEDAEKLLAESGVTGGLFVHIGCGKGKLITALAGEGRLVHGLDASADNVAKARAAIGAGGGLFYIIDEAPAATVALPAEWRLAAVDRRIVHALDAETGEVVWQHASGGRMNSGYRDWGRAGVQHVSGRLLVPDARTVYGFGRTRADPANSHVGIDKSVYRLFAASAEPKDRGNWRKIDKWKSAARYRWRRKTPVLVRAMLLAKDTLFIAGPANLLSKKNAAATAALAGKSGGQLRAVAARDGKQLAEYKLDAPPVFDGMAGANGRLYLAATDGHVVCFAPSGSEEKSK